MGIFNEDHFVTRKCVTCYMIHELCHNYHADAQGLQKMCTTIWNGNSVTEITATIRIVSQAEIDRASYNGAYPARVHVYFLF